jgi:hypothetical protein
MQTNKSIINNNETIPDVIRLIIFLILPDSYHEILQLRGSMTVVDIVELDTTTVGSSFAGI